MPYQFAHYTIAMLTVCIVLYCKRYIANPVTLVRLGYSSCKRFFGNTHQFQQFRLHITYSKCISMIAMITIHVNTTIYRNDITIFQFIIARKTMNNNFVHRNTKRSRKRRI